MTRPTGRVGVCMASSSAGAAAAMCSSLHSEPGHQQRDNWAVLFTWTLVLLFVLTLVRGDFRVAAEYKTTLSQKHCECTAGTCNSSSNNYNFGCPLTLKSSRGVFITTASPQPSCLCSMSCEQHKWRRKWWKYQRVACNIRAVGLVSRGFMAVYCNRASLRRFASDWKHSYVSGNILLQLCHWWAEDQRLLCSGHRVSRYS